MQTYRISKAAIGCAIAAVSVVSAAGCGEGGEQTGDDPDGYQITAAVDGLELGPLVVSNGGDDPVSVDENGTHRLWKGLSDGTGYEVVVEQTPPAHHCQVDGGSGTIAGADVDDVTVDCVFDASQAEASIRGVVTDVDGEELLGGIDVIVSDFGGDEIRRVTADDDGAYLIEGLEPGAYEISLEAPGLKPDYTIEESDFGDEGVVELEVLAGEYSQALTVEWRDELELVVDGGKMDFRPDSDTSPLSMDLPGCRQVDDGSWQPVDVDPGHDEIDISYEPDDQCFRIESIGVDLESGQLDVDTDDIVFPLVEVELDDSDDNLDENIETIEVEFQWLFDDISGQVDFTTGQLDLHLGMRILVGGTGYPSVGRVDFGSRFDYLDCQFTGGWGGDVENPTEDVDERQIGEYLHDPIDLHLTTGASGPGEVTGIGYDGDERRFVTVDNAFEVARLSEGDLGAGDPGGPACSELDISFGDFTVEQDFAATFNDFGELPAASGDVLGEFQFVIR